MNDPINPKHYKHLPAEAIDIIEAAIAKAPSNKAAYLHGQVLKYLLRCWEKKGIEDLRKAKWYLDRLINRDQLAEVAGAIPGLPIEEPMPSRAQPPSGHRLLGDAKDEPRQADDLYWSDSYKYWTPIGFQVSYANIHNWAACRKIKPTKRYREPTQADLAKGPIACEYRDDDDEQWRSGFLTHILKGCAPFLCQEEYLGGQWKQCQIEVAE